MNKLIIYYFIDLIIQIITYFLIYGNIGNKDIEIFSFIWAALLGIFLLSEYFKFKPIDFRYSIFILGRYGILYLLLTTCFIIIDKTIIIIYIIINLVGILADLLFKHIFYKSKKNKSSVGQKKNKSLLYGFFLIGASIIIITTYGYVKYAQYDSNLSLLFCVIKLILK